jgi:ribosome biogenesis protein SSF1/2
VNCDFDNRNPGCRSSKSSFYCDCPEHLEFTFHHIQTMPRKGRQRKKSRTHVADTENVIGTLTNSEETKVPKSLVVSEFFNDMCCSRCYRGCISYLSFRFIQIRRGKCETIVADLVYDVRKLMMPYTASNFKEDANYRKLTLHKYCQHVCLPLGISHMLAFSQNDERLAMRLAKTPQGPTLTFRVHQFSLAKHIQNLQRRPVNTNSLTNNPPIVVTNNFGDSTAPPQVKLMRITFQNMFPAINVASVKLKECRRVVLFHLIEGEEGEAARVEVRHYAIKATPVGVNKKVRRLIQTKIPNLNKVQDIADYIQGTATASTNVDVASDSEPEDNNAVVELAQNYAGRGNKGQSKSALKLVELGPRLSLELIKVEQGLGDGNVMFHAHIHKSPAEAKEIQQKLEGKTQLKKNRRAEQERNVDRKRRANEDKRDGKRQRKEDREKSALDELRQKEHAASDDDDDEDLLDEDLGISDDDEEEGDSGDDEEESDE